jgi:hypothetical protein
MAMLAARGRFRIDNLRFNLARTIVRMVPATSKQGMDEERERSQICQ